jgi:hypothetical protein
MITTATTHNDEITLTLIAHGLVQLASSLEQGQPLSVPYPESLQQALDRMTVAAWQRGDVPPHGIPELLYWCAERPLAAWPFALPEGAIGAEDQLLTMGLPSELCLEWAMQAGGDIEASLQEERLMEHVLRLCREQGRQDAYVAFRELLIKRPVLRASELLTLRTTEPLTVLIDALREAYAEAPEICVDPQARQLATCGRCGNLLLHTRDHTWTCLEDSCRAEGQTTIGTTYPVDNSVLWITRGLRRFVAGPGRAEVRLAAELRALGLEVELWPGFDAYDLRVVFPQSGQVWALDVKDWVNPFSLGKKLRDDVIPARPPWHQAYYVIPAHRRTRRRDYKDALLAQWRPRDDQRIAVCFTDDLLRKARRAM